MHIRAYSLDRRLLQNALRASGLSLKAVAEKARISQHTARMVRRGYLISARMRHRFEIALGRAVWTSDADFARKQALVAWLGFDPFLLNIRVTRAHAIQRGIKTSGENPSRALVLARLWAAFDAAHPAPQPRPKRAAGKISTADIPPTGKAKTTTEKRTP